MLIRGKSLVCAEYLEFLPFGAAQRIRAYHCHALTTEPIQKRDHLATDACLPARDLLVSALHVGFQLLSIGCQYVPIN